MPDKVSAEVRSRTMSRIRSRDTKPEPAVRKLVHAMGCRYRLHVKGLPGTPDLVFPRRRKAIFVHGCFWHQHEAPACPSTGVLLSRRVYWLPKLHRNQERDRTNLEQLRNLGWGVAVVWECDIRDMAALASKHIKGVPDAYQNVGKNSTNLARGNVLVFDDFLRWMNSASGEEVQAALHLVTARVALTARPVRPMPRLDHSALTFAAVARVLNELLGTPSGGAHEQFAVAAFLHALIDEFGMGSVGGLRAETKPINASDASAGTAADVQVKRGNRTEEAFEVTANAWRTKVAGAAATVRTADLQRVHVLASVPGGAIDDVADLLTQPVDISVLDVRAFLHGLTAMMRKPARADKDRQTDVPERESGRGAGRRTARMLTPYPDAGGKPPPGHRRGRWVAGKCQSLFCSPQMGGKSSWRRT